MEANIQNIVKQTSVLNRQLAEEIAKPVLGLSHELDMFFTNENDGMILLASIYHFLIGKSANKNCPIEFLPCSPKYVEGLLYPGSFDRRDEIINLTSEIKTAILNAFDVTINRFDKDQSDWIYFRICYELQDAIIKNNEL